MDFLSCSLTGGIYRQCGISPVSGATDTLILLPFSKISGYTFSALNKTVVTAILRMFGGEAFKFEGRTNTQSSNNAKVTAEQGTFFAKIKHEVTFHAFGNHPEIAVVLESLKDVRTVAILKTANGYYEIFGHNNGLSCSYERDLANDDNGGGTLITLMSEKEGSGQYAFAIDYDNTNKANPTYDNATTRIEIDKLLEPITMDILGVSAAANPIVTVASTAELSSGMGVTFSGIIWTTAPANTLNENAYIIKVLTATTFRIESAVNGALFDTTGGVYGSDGVIFKYYS